jgi:nitrogenase molybdenum-iron protein NifN
VIGSSHALDTANRLDLPLLRAGYPLHDQFGGYQRAWIGYRGARQALFDLANALLGHAEHAVAPLSLLLLAQGRSPARGASWRYGDICGF